MSKEATKGALDGVRVLDLSRVLAGPWCTQNLADLGAEVIKIERPDGGDDTRAWGPPYMRQEDGSDGTESTYYMCCNRGKKSVTIDIASAEGQRFIRELAATCDVVVENFKVGQLARYGLDYESLRRVNPSLVYCSITGFGQDGPWADRPGYDFVAQGLSGFMSITGEHASVPGTSPQKAGAGIADLFTGMYATMGVLAALRHRDRTGEGQYLDVSLLDCMVAAMSNHNTCYLNSGKVSQRLGNAHQNIVPYQTFATSDGHMIIGVGNDGQFRRFCEIAGCSSLADDPRYALNTDRVKRREELIPQIEAIVRTRSKSWWIEQLENAGVPCAPINSMDEVFDNVQIKARGLQIDLPHPSGTAHLVGCPVRMSVTPPQYPSAPPLLGQHNAEFAQRPSNKVAS